MCCMDKIRNAAAAWVRFDSPDAAWVSMQHRQNPSETAAPSVARDSFSFNGQSDQNGQERNAPFGRITPSLKEVFATLGTVSLF